MSEREDQTDGYHIPCYTHVHTLTRTCEAARSDSTLCLCAPKISIGEKWEVAWALDDEDSNDGEDPEAANVGYKGVCVCVCVCV